ASYPFAIEPRMTTTVQAYVWSIAYTLFTLLCAVVAFSGMARASDSIAAAETPAPDAVPPPSPDRTSKWPWIVLPAMGTWLLLAVTNHITQNLASIPFLWLLPLTLYLATLIICFDHDRWYRRAIVVAPALALLAAAAYGLQTDD